MFCFLGVDVHDPLASIMWVLRHGGDEISYRSFNRVCKSFLHDSLDENELSCDILERFTRHRGIGTDTSRAPFTRGRWQVQPRRPLTRRSDCSAGRSSSTRLWARAIAQPL